MSCILDALFQMAAANPKIWSMVEEMTGGPEHTALLLAKFLSEGTTTKISADAVARLCDISKSAAYDRINAASISQKPENTRQ